MSKIKITVDVCESYDRLCILEIKSKTTKETSKLELLNQQINLLINEIISQIGEEQHKDIYLSNEYATLYNCNFLTFKLIDDLKIKNDPTLGKKIDNQNYLRYLAKSELQKTFFSQSPQELKFGY